LCSLCGIPHKLHYGERRIMWNGRVSAEAVVVSAPKLSA
jgi:hypothetical protein